MLTQHSNADFLQKLTPQLLKPAVSKGLNALLAPIQEAYQASETWQEIATRAYQPPPKKEKKVKNRGTRFPGTKDEEATREKKAAAIPEMPEMDG